MPSDKYKEYAVVNREGWTRIVDGGSTRYCSPGGTEISNRQYYNLSKNYPPPDPIPEDAVSTAAGIQIASESMHKSASTSSQPFMTGATAPALETEQWNKTPPPRVDHPDPSAQRLAAEQSQPQQQENREPESRFRDNITEIGARTGVGGKSPRGRSTDKRYKHPRATKEGLGLGIKKLLLLITVLGVAKVLNDDRAAMTEQEATILGMALGSLLEPTHFNEEWGWVIAETGDWQAIGYVLIMYVSRINDIVQDKRRAAAGGQQARYSDQAPSAPASSQNGAVRNTAPGAFMPMNPNLKSPPGIYPG
jgi:hypothetical protein